MNKGATGSKAGTGRLFRSVFWMVCGIVLAFVLILDPLDLHPIDTWLQGVFGYHRVETLSSETDRNQLWTCGMHPQVLETEPGQCPICGMNLVPASDVPAYAESSSSIERQEGSIQVDTEMVQNMNVRTVEAERRDIRHRIRTVGYLEYDQELMVTVTTKYQGWVEKVYTNYVGERVEKGQPLFEIYSPELVQTEHELLSAVKHAHQLAGAPEEARMRAEALAEAARLRLQFWDIAPEQIEQLEETGEIFRTLKVVSPASGLVMKKIQGLEGMAVQPGMEIFHIGDLSTLWLSVEVFEDQVAWIDVGTSATVRFTYFPEKTFQGTVRIIEPEFSEQTRTLPVKLSIPNADGKLRAGMFATVIFEPVAAASVVSVPSLAILRTGQRDLVVIEQGGGRFEPRPVTLGREGDGFVQILEGVTEGERVVTSAQFLLDSEANLREAVQKMAANQSPGSGG